MLVFVTLVNRILGFLKVNLAVTEQNQQNEHTTLCDITKGMFFTILFNKQDN